MFDNQYPRAGVSGWLAVVGLVLATAAPTFWFLGLSDPAAGLVAQRAVTGAHGITPIEFQAAVEDGALGLDLLDNVFTVAFLHLGYDHLAFNLVPLALFGWMTARRIGAVGFLAVWALGLVVTGLFYAMSGTPLSTLVGASGGTHWLAGLWIGWAMLDRTGSYLFRVWPAVMLVVAMLLANLLVVWLKGLGFAWDLHIFGIVTGMAAAPFLPARRPEMRNAAP